MYPKLRFKGFDDAWEQRKLSELATMHARIGWQNLRTSEFLDSGDYMLITGTDFEDGKVNYSTCHYVEKERYDQDKNIQIKNGSILITKDGTLGKVAYVEGLSMPATLNAGVFNVEVRNENETDRKYLFQFLKAPFLMDYVAQKATGGTIKHLNQNILVDFPIAMPSKAEQIRIGEYFTNIDNLITLHQRQCEVLKKQKQFFLQNMFPKEGESVPRIRFNGFTEPWEQRKFKEIAIVRRGLTYSPKDVSSQGVRVLRSSNIEGEFFLLHNDDVFVNSEVVKIEYVKRGDILITAANGSPKLVGKHAIIDSTSSDLPMVHGGFMLVASSNFSDFLNASMGSFWYSSFLKRNVTGGNGAIGNLSKADLDEVTILLPSDNEKIKIGAFFKNLDNLITLHQRQYEQLVSLKKYLLSKMFI